MARMTAIHFVLRSGVSEVNLFGCTGNELRIDTASNIFQRRISTMISLAHSLSLKVVAEGVDSEEQAKALARLGCDEMQGYLFSKPVPALQLISLLQGS